MQAASVKSVVRLSLLPGHPVAALICKAFWPLRYRAAVIAVIILKRPSKSLVEMIILPVAFNGNQGSTKTGGCFYGSRARGGLRRRCDGFGPLAKTTLKACSSFPCCNELV